MAMDPETLLAGPRGRRFVLEFARGMVNAGEDGPGRDLALTLSALEYDLRPSDGTSVLIAFSPVGESVAPAPSYVPEDLARLLADLPLGELSDRRLVESLQDAVDNARYWQEPDGADALAALPVLRSGLARIAEHLCRLEFVAGFERGPGGCDPGAVLA